MNLRPLLIALAFAAVLAPADARVRYVTDPDAPRALPEQGPVSVRWEDPSKFSDLRYSGKTPWTAASALGCRSSWRRRASGSEGRRRIATGRPPRPASRSDRRSWSARH